MAALATACASAPAPVEYAPRTLYARAEAAPAPPFMPENEPHIFEGGGFLQCVPYARDVSGVEIYGNANTWWDQAAGRFPRSSLPGAGAVMVMKGYHTTARGHVAVVVSVDGPRLIRVNHANWLNHGEITTSVPVIDVSEANDWSQVRVWNIPSRQWGARVYEVQGYIYPMPVWASN